jgi:hypothetical protein
MDEGRVMTRGRGVADFKTDLGRTQPLEDELNYKLGLVRPLAFTWDGSHSDFDIRIEYKFDFRAATTGNLFLELSDGHSNDQTGALDRAAASATLLVYIVPPVNSDNSLEKAAYYVLDPIKAQMLAKDTSYPRRDVRNGDYTTVGRAVPLSVVLERAGYCSVVFDLEWLYLEILTLAWFAKQAREVGKFLRVEDYKTLADEEYGRQGAA